jgi:hypothetical protein
VKTYYGEIFIISVILGLLLESWLVAGLSFFLLAVGINIPILSTLIILGMCIVWGLGGFILGSILTPMAGVVLGIIFFLWSLAVHRSAREYTNDLTDLRDRSRF